MIEATQSVIPSVIPDLKTWALTIVGYIGAIELISGSVSNLRLSIGRRWVSIAKFVFIYLFCIGSTIGLDLLSHEIAELTHDIKYPNYSTQITKNWGMEMSIEKRTKLSQQVARDYFVNKGCACDYIDFDGNLRAYQPSEEDRQARALRLTNIETLERSVRLTYGAGIIWLFIPLIGIGVGFTTLNERIDKNIAKLKRLIAGKRSK